MKIIKPFTVNYLSQIMQQKKTQYAHAVYNKEQDTITQVHQECLCRDFLGDVVVANQQGESYSIYGMKYDPEKDTKIDLNTTCMLVYFPTEEDVQAFDNNFKFLTVLEKSYGISESKVIQVDKLIRCTISDGWWQKELYRFSFYTFLLRCMAYKVDNLENLFDEIVDKYSNTNERGYIIGYNRAYFNKFVKFLPVLKKHGLGVCYKSGTQWTLPNDIIYIHNYTGFVSYIKKSGVELEGIK